MTCPRCEHAPQDCQCIALVGGPLDGEVRFIPYANRDHRLDLGETPGTDYYFRSGVDGAGRARFVHETLAGAA